MARTTDLKRAEEAVEALGRLYGGDKFASERAQIAGIALGKTAQRLLWFIVTEGPIRISDLARSAGTSDPIASRQVASLENAGYVERMASPEDGRVWLVRSTPAGRRAGKRLRQATDRTFETIMQDWSGADLDALTTVVERLVRSIHDAHGSRASNSSDSFISSAPSISSVPYAPSPDPVSSRKSAGAAGNRQSKLGSHA